MTECIVKASAIKEICKANNKSMSSDLPDKLSEEVKVLVNKAIKRAADNGRQTVQGRDV